LTLSKPIYRADQSLIGVVSTDMPLEQLTEFLTSLSLGKNGVAFIMERSGALVATSVKEKSYKMDKNGLVRLKADASSSPLVRDAYSVVSRQLQSGARADPMLHEFDNSLGKVQAVSTVLQDSAGLDWVIVVAAPRSDFRGTVTASIYQSLIIGLIAVIIALILGFVILRRALADIRKLTFAARSIGSGEPFGALDIDRRDEIGQLAHSFQEMEHNLRTDRLTRVLNRDSLIAQIDFRCRNASDANPLRFALLFIDLDSFKLINDHYGHDKGDLVLMEVASRLQAAVRKDDSVARFGGDEFVVYLHGVDQETVVESVCEKIRAALEQPILVREGVADHIGASIGAACYPVDGCDSETLFRVADTRMFDAKKARKSLRADEQDNFTA
jgi:diguanylate cyclase (GGDEF)-like protein